MAYTPIWHIELCERPVKLARHLDYALFKRPLSHPFLALIDEDGNVAGEIHLGPYDRTRSTVEKKARTRLNRLFELSTAITGLTGIDKLVRTCVQHTPLHRYYPTIHSTFHSCATQYSRATERQVLICGAQSQINDLWTNLRAQAAEIDLQNLPYDRFGWGRGRHNCQTALAQVMENTGLNVLPLSGRYAAPGWHNT
jgi:hypothetical protein